MAETTPLRDIRKNIAYPKRWQDEQNPPVAYQAYPKMPLIQDRDAKGELTGKADIPIYDKQNQPLIWQTAREEAEWLKTNPEKAKLIAEAKAARPVTLDKATHELVATKDTNKRLIAERDEEAKRAAQALDELAAARAELAAMRKAKAVSASVEVGNPNIATTGGTVGMKLDMRTKAGRAAAKAAAEG